MQSMNQEFPGYYGNLKETLEALNYVTYVEVH